MMHDMITDVQSPLVVAVSGGVDSVSLLHMLTQKKAPIIVAHVNHGMRPESDEDESFVRELTSSYKVPFVSTRLQLGPKASEDTARKARYEWLQEIAKHYGSETIVTAHHQDDVLETIFINLLRGTGWRGLCSLRSSTKRLRPLLSMSKAEIVRYAIENELVWHEDSSNESFKYLRNRLRLQTIPRLTIAQRKHLWGLYESQILLRERILEEASTLTAKYSASKAIRRYPLITIDSTVAMELLKTWLGESLEQKRMLDLLLFTKVARPGDRWSLDGARYVCAEQTRLIVLTPLD